MFDHFNDQERFILTQRAHDIARDKTDDQQDNAISALRCRVGTEWYAVPLDELTAIYEEQNVVPVPGTPLFLKGITNIRGRIVPVLDLNILLNLEALEDETTGEMVVVQHEAGTIALLVAEVKNVTTYLITELDRVPEEIQTYCIHDCLADGTLLLDVHALLHDSDLVIDI